MLEAAELLEPTGELDPADIWPDLDEDAVDEKLEAYLAEGYAKAADIAVEADQDEAAKQWAYHRAYKGAYRRLLLAASTVTLNDEGSSSYLLTQIEHVGEEAEKALAEFQRLIDIAIAAEVEETPVTRESASVPVSFRF